MQTVWNFSKLVRKFVSLPTNDPPGFLLTVKEICTLAEINRAAFYKYYADAYDLMEKIEDEMLLELQETHKKYPNLFEAQRAWIYVYTAQGSSGILNYCLP